MSQTQQIDPMILFFEAEGVYLLPRQLDFCKAMLKHCDEIKAAKLAGYPAPERDGPILYSAYSHILELWRKHEKSDFLLVVNAYRKAAQATNTITLKSDDPEAPAETEEVPNYGVQMKGANGLADIFGFKAPVKQAVDVTAKHELPQTLQDKIAHVYQQATS